MLYFNEFTSHNITYSIDMLRLKTYISYAKFSEINFRFQTVWKSYVKKLYNSPAQQQFYYNFVIEVEEGCSFWFGFCHNSERRSFDERAEYNFTIEFNPNKLKQNKILMYLLNISGKWFIRRFDLAMDLQVGINDIIYDIGQKRETKIYQKSYDDKSIYFGVGDGRVKIYNKKKESNLDINYELTRIEVTKEVDDFPISDIKVFSLDVIFPYIYFKNYVYSIDDYSDKTLLAIMYAVQAGYPIKDLTKTYKHKVKLLLNGGYKILFDRTVALKALTKTIFSYFINNPKVYWR